MGGWQDITSHLLWKMDARLTLKLWWIYFCFKNRGKPWNRAESHEDTFANGTIEHVKTRQVFICSCAHFWSTGTGKVAAAMRSFPPSSHISTQRREEGQIPVWWRWCSLFTISDTGASAPGPPVHGSVPPIAPDGHQISFVGTFIDVWLTLHVALTFFSA